MEPSFPQHKPSPDPQDPRLRKLNPMSPSPVTVVSGLGASAAMTMQDSRAYNNVSDCKNAPDMTTVKEQSPLVQVTPSNGNKQANGASDSPSRQPLRVRQEADKHQTAQQSIQDKQRYHREEEKRREDFARGQVLSWLQPQAQPRAQPQPSQSQPQMQPRPQTQQQQQSQLQPQLHPQSRSQLQSQRQPQPPPQVHPQEQTQSQRQQRQPGKQQQQQDQEHTQTQPQPQFQKQPQPQFQKQPQPQHQQPQHSPDQQKPHEMTWTELDSQDSKAMTELQIRDINQLLREMSLLDLVRSDPPVFKDDANPTGEEIKALLQFYKEKSQKCCHLQATIHVRFVRIESSIRKLVTFDRTFMEKACKQLQERKEHTMVLLRNEMSALKMDIESLTEILAYMTEFDKSQEEQRRQEFETKCRTTIRWNPTIPEHDRLREIFGLEDIPVITGTDDIDYGQVGLRIFQSSPFLNLELPESISDTRIFNELICGIAAFIQEFEMYYREKLGVLFEHIAWKYMRYCLSRKSDIQDRYDGHILRVDKTAITWDHTKTFLRKAIGLDILRPHLIRKILTLTPKPKELFASFADRLTPLLDTAGVSDAETGLVVLSIVSLLSDFGVQVVLNEYGSLDAIPSLRDFLVLLSNTPNALGEPHTDRSHLFLLRYGGPRGAKLVRKDIQANRSEGPICWTVTTLKNQQAAAISSRETIVTTPLVLAH
ncbi:hypothetical protein EMPS_00376 [Entomortierella parvispora]|uniref:Uncharacterized protein n=1 Tax=Entomortierella parvispora TaxID=205924 RepID=A0A9P3H0Y6_9FUNG|nr:hypothetical protein EMPS_00376 [Entomortierella parvispora]